MGLTLPGNIPVAAESFEALLKLGDPWPLGHQAQALVLVTKNASDPCMVWASPKLGTYRAIWTKASASGFVEAADEWGDNVDIDHVFPQSWANLPGSNVSYVRLFPVWAEINRSAGAGREKQALKAGITTTREHGIVFAQELQVLKILGHPVGTVSDPVSIFGVKRRR
ncbi:hypothetical protein CI1B_13550 [Bradyrhizobium ivorense]|uniref:DUF1524 domain-containing protein n=1 Tax=Bradyrhizobium ivorense TaxID=2511166 RepID=A0A508SWE3_9BRAD|nr:hypothetical protein [Bradyrhizobium ivorense]VIO66236.1 hypothetical protein CI1B_13550 [Bradyrhizobium ivorense]